MSASRGPGAESAGQQRPFVAVVPVRAGSRGLPDKNVRRLAGKPLYMHAVDQGRSAGAERVLVTTDIDEILEADHGPGVVIIERPDELCGDDVPMDPVLVHAVEHANLGDVDVVLLQATSPLRSPDDIHGCLELFRSGEFGLVMSVCPVDRSILKSGTANGCRFEPLRSAADTFANRQSLPEVFRPNGAVYVFSADRMLRDRTLASEVVGMFEMDEERSVDIDSADDFERCELLLAAGAGASP